MDGWQARFGVPSVHEIESDERQLEMGRNAPAKPHVGFEVTGDANVGKAADLTQAHIELDVMRRSMYE